MNHIRNVAVVATLTVLAIGAIQAGEGHGMASGTMSSSPGNPTHAGQAMPMEGGHDGGHAHDSWPKPPAAYVGSVNYAGWENREAARRGQPVFEQQCAVCHGADGRGTGPAAAALEHKPADLNKHFHTPGKQGDAYLFWRVTEGGQAAPFADSGSMMPAFRQVLTEQERWDVLTYVHQAFHETNQADPQDGHGARGDIKHDEGPSHDS